MTAWAKMASNLDSNPKIRRAGRDAREVFLFIVRRNADLDLGGRVPRQHCEPWYLADQLMMSENEACHGMSRAVAADLIRDEGAFFAIVGWDDQWSKRPLSPTERKQKQRAKDAATKPMSRKVTKPNVTGHESHACHALEESREEKKREEKKAEATAAPSQHQPAVDAFDGYYKRTHGGAKPTWNGKTIAQVKTLVGKHGAQEVVRRISVLELTPPSFPPSPWDIGTFVQHFDKCAVSRAGPSTGRAEPHAVGDYPQGEVSL